MKTKKQLGIWMDHASANLMDVNKEPIITKTIKSDFTHQEKERTAVKGEFMMHNDEQQKQHSYYNQIGKSMQGYDSVLIFGPTDAKKELVNLLKQDHHYDKIKIEVMDADKMTENQQHAFVKNYFMNT